MGLGLRVGMEKKMESTLMGYIGTTRLGGSGELSK